MYAALLEKLDSAHALEILCGLYVSGYMSSEYLEHVFSGELRRVTRQLDGMHGPGGWVWEYPSISQALTYLEGPKGKDA